MSEPRRRWDGLEVVTASVVATAAVVGGLGGLLNGARQDGPAARRLLVGVLQGAGGAVLLGFMALLVVTLATAGWSLLRALWRRIRG